VLDSGDFQRVVDYFRCALDIAVYIRVFYAQQELAASRTRDEILVQSRAQIADVHVPRWAWRETGSDGFMAVKFHSIIFLLL